MVVIDRRVGGTKKVQASSYEISQSCNVMHSLVTIINTLYCLFESY